MVTRVIFGAGKTRDIVASVAAVQPEGTMISFVAAVLLSFITLCLGTYVADRVEQRHCAACGLAAEAQPDRAQK